MSSFSRHSDVRFGRMLQEMSMKMLEVYALGMIVFVVVLAIVLALERYKVI